MGQLQATDWFENHWRWAKWALVALAIGLQSLQVCYIGNYHHGFFNPDKAVQIAAARALLDGHGLTSSGANSADASQPLRYPLTQWPMGYSVLFAALWPVFGDLWNTALVIEILGTVLFFTAWLAILEWQGQWIDARVKLLVMGYWALVWNPLNVQTCTEMLSLGLLCWALAFCLRAAADRRAVLSSVAAAVCVALAAWFRYAYWPLAMVVPATLAVAFLFSPHRRRLAVATVLNTALAGGLVLGVIALQRVSTGHTTCLTGIRERELVGLSWSNLLWTCPFPSAALGFSDIWPFVVRQVRPLAAIPELQLDWLLSAVVVVAIGWWAAAALLRIRRSATGAARLSAETRPVDRTGLATLVAAGVLTTGVTIAMLIYLSVRTPLDGTYTYVIERRYFAVFYPFVSVALGCAVVDFLRHRGPRWSVVAKMAFVTVVLVWVAAGATWRVGRIVRHYCDAGGQRTLRRADRSDCRQVSAAVRRHLDAGRQTLFIHPLGGTWFTSHGEKLEPILALMAGAPNVSYDTVRHIGLRPGKSVALLAVVPDAGSPAAAQAAQFIDERGGFARSVRLRDGWLYESIWCAPRTARSNPTCPPR